MKCLGIESTAHTFGIAVVDDKGNIISESKKMYTNPDSGIDPRKAADHHKNVKEEVLKEALGDLTFSDIDFISFSKGPGLPPCLFVGFHFAKELAEKYKKPIIGVNHCVSHLTIGNLLTKAKDPVYVFTSGANTQIIAYEGKKYRVFGEVLSIAVGNALDKFGRAMGFGFPAGPKIEELAKKGKYIELPYVVKGMDIELSGIVTEAIKKFKQGVSKEDLCCSLQETIFAMLTEVSERALAHCNKKEVLLIGGVAANKRLCEMLDIMCKERGAKFYAAPLKYSGDNAVQIAWQGILEYKNGRRMKIEELDINPRWRVDQVDVNWL